MVFLCVFFFVAFVSLIKEWMPNRSVFNSELFCWRKKMNESHSIFLTHSMEIWFCLCIALVIPIFRYIFFSPWLSLIDFNSLFLSSSHLQLVTSRSQIPNVCQKKNIPNRRQSIGTTLGYVLYL